jgi:hypothetical protein
MKKKASDKDELRAEYDFASMKGGVRGKYVRRLRKGTNVVLIEPEIAKAFPTEAVVNEALRGVLNNNARRSPQRGLDGQGLDRAGRAATWRTVAQKSRIA